MKFISTGLFIFFLVGISAQFRLIDLQVSKGKSTRHIQLNWSTVYGNSSYIVYRADKPNSQFIRIAEVPKTSYTDTTCRPGIEYFYKVSIDSPSRETDFSVVQTGYRRIDLSEMFDLEKELDKKKQTVPFLRTVDKTRLRQLEPLYESWFQLQLILLCYTSLSL
jgi:hypothetical protein